MNIWGLQQKRKWKARLIRDLRERIRKVKSGKKRKKIMYSITQLERSSRMCASKIRELKAKRDQSKRTRFY